MDSKVIDIDQWDLAPSSLQPTQEKKNEEVEEIEMIWTEDTADTTSNLEPAPEMPPSNNANSSTSENKQPEEGIKEGERKKEEINLENEPMLEQPPSTKTKRRDYLTGEFFAVNPDPKEEDLYWICYLLENIGAAYSRYSPYS